MTKRKSLGQIVYETEYRLRGRAGTWEMESQSIRNFYENVAGAVKAAVLDEQRKKKERNL